MAKPRPLRRIHIPLAGKRFITCVIWRTRADMHAALAPEPADYDAITVHEKGTALTSRIHLSRESLNVGVIAHEVRHAIDHYQHVMLSEHMAEMTERCLDAIHGVVEEIG